MYSYSVELYVRSKLHKSYRFLLGKKQKLKVFYVLFSQYTLKFKHSIFYSDASFLISLCYYSITWEITYFFSGKLCILLIIWSKSVKVFVEKLWKKFSLSFFFVFGNVEDRTKLLLSFIVKTFNLVYFEWFIEKNILEKIFITMIETCVGKSASGFMLCLPHV